MPTHVAGVLEHESGPVATLVTSFDVHASRYRFLEVYGSQGTLAVPDPNTFGGPVQLRRAGDADWADVPLRVVALGTGDAVVGVVPSTVAGGKVTFAYTSTFAGAPVSGYRIERAP